MTAGIAIGAGLSQQLIKRVGVRNISVFGLVVAAAGMLYLTQLPVNGSYVSDLLVGLLPMSIGMGLVFVPVTLLATSGVSADDSGLASGLFNTAQQVGGSLGLAILSTLAATQTSKLLSDHSATELAARVSGYHVAFLAASIMLAAGAAIMAVGLRQRHMKEVSSSSMRARWLRRRPRSHQLVLIDAFDRQIGEFTQHGIRAPTTAGQMPSETAADCWTPRPRSSASADSTSASGRSPSAPAWAAAHCFATSRPRSI